MTQEEKELLFKDLCCRLPYGVILDNGVKLRRIDALTKIISGSGSDRKLEHVRPYLRPMSSMTEEEKDELKKEHFKDEALYAECLTKAANGDNSMRGKVITHFGEDWCNANHFDYRGLIPLGLAIEVTEENNPYNR